MDRGDNDSDVAESGRVLRVAVVLERDGARRQEAVVRVEDTAMAAGTGDAGCVRAVARMDVVHSGPSPGDCHHRGRRNGWQLEVATTDEDQAVSGSTKGTGESVEEQEDNPAGNYHDCQNYAGDHDQGNDYADVANLDAGSENADPKCKPISLLSLKVI